MGKKPSDKELKDRLALPHNIPAGANQKRFTRLTAGAFTLAKEVRDQLPDEHGNQEELLQVLDLFAQTARRVFGRRAGVPEGPGEAPITVQQTSAGVSSADGPKDEPPAEGGAGI